MNPISVLIVEDVDSMRSLLALLLEGVAGLTVSGQARNTAEARLEISRRRPSLVLLDEVLPGESSLELLAELKAAGIPVLLLTGLEDPTHPLPGGAAARLSKPDFDLFEEEKKRFSQAIFQAFSKR